MGWYDEIETRQDFARKARPATISSKLRPKTKTIDGAELVALKKQNAALAKRVGRYAELVRLCRAVLTAWYAARPHEAHIAKLAEHFEEHELWEDGPGAHERKPKAHRRLPEHPGLTGRQVQRLKKKEKAERERKELFKQDGRIPYGEATDWELL